MRGSEHSPRVAPPTEGALVPEAPPLPTAGAELGSGPQAGRAAEGPAIGDGSHEREQHRERLVAALRGDVWPAPPGRLQLLRPRFGLSTFEADILALLWVCAYEAELRAQAVNRETYAAQLTVRLAAQLFGQPARVRLSSESPLLLWRMVQEHPLIDGNAALASDPGIIAWLDGEFELDRVLAGHVRLLERELELPSWQLGIVAQRLNVGLRHGQRWRVHVRGEDAVARRWFAAGLGRRLGLPVMAVNPGAFPPDALAEVSIHLHRQAFLDGCVPCFAAADTALSSPPGVVPYPLQLVLGGDGLPDSLPGVQDIEWTLPAPDATERELLWRHALPEVAAWPAAAVADLSLRHEAGAGDILGAAAAQPTDPTRAAQALRAHRRGDLAPFAKRIDATFGWDDLILPSDVRRSLEDLAFEARERSRVWADPRAARLFPYGRGLIAMFAGPPGTGKTMAAQVIAADLGLDLLAVDISAVISKWVGETAQHLQRVLSAPAARRAILFFDEADALYGKRVDEVRDAQDRYANIDTSHLMTALETYPGIVLLASNLKANIDSAFLRRIRHVVDFPKPDAAAREHLWQRALSALFPAEQAAGLAPALPRLAQIEATGAVIKSAALSALFAARRTGRAPDVRSLGETLARELAKEGTGLSARELGALLETPV